MVRRGRLHPLHREAFAVGHRCVNRHGRWLAAVLACGEGAVLSHESAACLWGLGGDRRLVDVNADSGRQGRLRREGIRLHRCQMPAEQRTLEARIPVTTVARTLFDLSEVVDFSRLRRAWEEADRLKLLRLAEVGRVCAQGRGRRALRPTRLLLASATAPTTQRSPLEERFHDFCVERRVPPPASNVLVLGHEVDTLWPEAKLILELDSWEFHHHRAAFNRDRARDSALLVAGYRTIRVTHDRLDTEADTLHAELRSLLSL
jgi:very-short-patch-repair endonuclease